MSAIELIIREEDRIRGKRDIGNNTGEGSILQYR